MSIVAHDYDRVEEIDDFGHPDFVSAYVRAFDADHPYHRADQVEQDWIKYRAERALRIPPEARHGLDITDWEPDPAIPFHVPRKRDFNGDNVAHMHAVRDFIVQLHWQQIRGAEKRKRDHPGLAFGKWMSRKAGGVTKIIGQLAAMYGKPLIGLAGAIGGSLIQSASDHTQISEDAKAMALLAAISDEMPANIYIDTSTGDLVTPQQEFLPEALEQAGLKSYVSHYEKVHGKVPSHYVAYEKDKRSLLAELTAAKKKIERGVIENIGGELSSQLVVAMLNFVGYTPWLKGISERFANSPGMRQNFVGHGLRVLDNVMGAFGDNQGTTPHQVVQEMIDSLDFSPDAMDAIRQMGVNDAIAFTLRDVPAGERMTVGQKRALEQLHKNGISEAGAQKLYEAEFVAEGSISTPEDNAIALEKKGASPEMVRAAREVESVHSQAYRLSAARIEKMKDDLLRATPDQIRRRAPKLRGGGDKPTTKVLKDLKDMMSTIRDYQKQFDDSDFGEDQEKLYQTEQNLRTFKRRMTKRITEHLAKHNISGKDHKRIDRELSMEADQLALHEVASKSYGWGWSLEHFAERAEYKKKAQAIANLRGVRATAAGEKIAQEKASKKAALAAKGGGKGGKGGKAALRPQ